MNKEMIDKTRCIPGFMEEYDELRRYSDIEREEHLPAALSNAGRDMQEYVPVLLGEKGDGHPATGRELPS